MPAVPSAGNHDPYRTDTRSAPLSLRFYRQEHHVVVEVAGNLDRSCTPSLLDPLLDVIEAQGNRSIALDLNGVVAMDSTGLNAVVSIHRLLETRGGTLVLQRPSATVRHLLELTGMNQVVTVVPMLEASQG